MTQGRLLWIDDEIDLLHAHIIFLQKRDYDVTTCSNGTDAIDLCGKNAYDLILLDENMPGLSGLETLAGIKEVQPNVPVVMVTKNEAEDIMDQAIGAKIADLSAEACQSYADLARVEKEHSSTGDRHGGDAIFLSAGVRQYCGTDERLFDAGRMDRIIQEVGLFGSWNCRRRTVQ